MRNKIVGYIVVGIALLMGYIIFSYNAAILSLAGDTCPITGPTCPHEAVSKQQIKVNLLILVFVVAIGAYLIFFSKEERIVTKVMRVKEQLQPKKLTKENYKKILTDLNEDEQAVLKMIIDAKGSIMQSELVERLSMTKVAVTRILDRLEGREIIERKRRGMTNVVILKA
jgi:uncharacterized membrane protein